MNENKEREDAPARPSPVLKDGHIIVPLVGADGKALPGSRRKTVSDLTMDELKAMTPRDVTIVAGSLIGVLHMKEIELARSHKQHAMAELNYWGRKHEEATKALTEAERLNREGNT